MQRAFTEIELPVRRAVEDLERFTRKRPAHYHVKLSILAPGRPARPEPRFGVIDYERWGQLWSRWNATPR